MILWVLQAKVSLYFHYLFSFNFNMIISVLVFKRLRRSVDFICTDGLCGVAGRSLVCEYLLFGFE